MSGCVKWYLSDIEYTKYGEITTHVRLIAGGALVRTMICSINQGSSVSTVFIPGHRLKIVEVKSTPSESFYALSEY